MTKLNYLVRKAAMAVLALTMIIPAAHADSQLASSLQSITGNSPTLAQALGYTNPYRYPPQWGSISGSSLSSSGWSSPQITPHLISLLEKTSRPILSREAIYNQVSKSTGTVLVTQIPIDPKTNAPQKDPKTGKISVSQSLGTCFFVANGVAATNYHVVRNRKNQAVLCKMEVILNVNGQHKRCVVDHVIGSDKEHDVALLDVPDAVGIAPLPLAESDSLHIGDDTFLYGSPIGIEGTFTTGNISGFRREEDLRDPFVPCAPDGDLVQITNPGTHGNSGSAVLNNRGEVVGIYSSIVEIQPQAMLAFAEHVRYVKALLISSGVRT